MKRHGYIQPTPATAELWTALAEAKRRRDFVEVGRLSAEIRTKTIRDGVQPTWRNWASQNLTKLGTLLFGGLQRR